MYQKYKKLFLVGILFCFFIGGCSSKMNDTNANLVENNGNKEETTDTMYDGLYEENETHIVNVNDIEAADTIKLFTNSMFDSGEDNFKEMSKEDVLTYFGLELDISSILSNMSENTDEKYGFYEFADGSIFAQQSFLYQSNEGQILKIIIQKDKLPVFPLSEAYGHEMETSKLFMQDLLIAHYINLDGKDTYYAEMLNDNLGTVIISEDLALDDFLLVIEYLIQMQQKGGL